jgi:hypothetical protein
MTNAITPISAAIARLIIIAIWPFWLPDLNEKEFLKIFVTIHP